MMTNFIIQSINSKNNSAVNSGELTRISFLSDHYHVESRRHKAIYKQ
jgi:hypothetical protein